MTVLPLRYLTAGLAVLVAGPLSAEEPASFGPQLRAFVAGHCVHCHGPDVQKSKLRLDALPATLSDKDTAATWQKVFDRLSRGEMPPKSEERPPEKDLRAVVTELQRQLHEASLAQQRREGRVVLRPLNRTQYETTLRDLFGMPVEVKDLLPDDNLAAGFDNVSAVLDVSSAHLLRYQEAAEKALRTVIPSHPPLTGVRRSPS